MGKLLKFGLVLLVLGIVATVAGFLISADNGETIFGNADYVKVEDSVDVGSITTLLINMENRKIIVGESTTGKIELVYYETEDDIIDMIVEGNTLTLENDVQWYAGFLGWQNWFRWSVGEQFVVYVNIPASVDFDVELDTNSGAVEVSGLANLETLDIDVTSGGITLQNLTTAGLNAESISGSVTLTNITAPTVDAGTTSGSVHLTDVTATSVAASSASGRITLTRVTATTILANGVGGSIHLTDVTATESMDLQTVSGSIEVVDGTTPELVCQTTSGSIDVSLYGVYLDYFCTFYTTTGSVSVDGEDVGEGPHHSGKANSAYLTTVSGDVDLNFLP